jgi:hypothetical protein
MAGGTTLPAGSRLNHERRAVPARCSLPEVIALTPQEEQLLDSLVERVNQTQLQEKDPDAEGLLNQRLGPNPDAIYILAQTVLVQNIALDQAKAQVAQLQQQVQQQRQQPAHATSFLGRLLGEQDPAPAPQQAPPYQPVQQYAPPPPPPPQYASPQYAPQQQFVPIAGGPPSFLRGAMQTAAGVAAGALAFEGVEAILHGIGGHGGYGWGGPGMGMGGFGMNPSFDQGGERHFHESADQSGAQLADANYNTAGESRGNELSDVQGGDRGAYDTADSDNSGGFDNSNLDDGTGYDDSGSYDDNGGGGGFDSGGGDFQ